MEITAQEYEKLKNMTFTETIELQDQIKTKDPKAVKQWFIYSVFNFLRFNLKTIPTLKRLNKVLNVFDEMEIN